MATDRDGTEWTRKRQYPEAAYAIPDGRNAYIAKLEQTVRDLDLVVREAITGRKTTLWRKNARLLCMRIAPIVKGTGAAVLRMER
jgi:hypothetical protein